MEIVNARRTGEPIIDRGFLAASVAFSPTVRYWLRPANAARSYGIWRSANPSARRFQVALGTEFVSFNTTGGDRAVLALRRAHRPPVGGQSQSVGNRRLRTSEPQPHRAGVEAIYMGPETSLTTHLVEQTEAEHHDVDPSVLMGEVARVLWCWSGRQP